MQTLLIMSVGPVQGFIAAARRSRDLWAGSWMLSELAKACAKSLHDQGAELIFPAVADPAWLAPGTDFSVGNKIQVVIEAASPEQVRQCAAQAAEATRKRFRDLADEAYQLVKSEHLRTDIWKQQVDDYLEIQSAWAQIQGDYKQAVTQASQALAARKATRNFAPSPLEPGNGAYQLPKSSLDGARETVLFESSQNKPHPLRQRLRLADSEQLDCAGVTKRMGAADIADRFTPFSRVAADAWISDIHTKAPEKLKALCSAYEALVSAELATRVIGNPDSQGRSIYAAFPYDAQLCYPNRLAAALRDNRHHADHTERLDALQKVLRPLWKEYGAPSSYGVLLLADGDAMGKLIDAATRQSEHQQITQALSGFAEGVNAVVRKYRGHALYAGGDDVLAFVPLHESVACADDLRQTFVQHLQAVAKQLQVPAPTLSVGLAIAHMLQPLGQIREQAQRAEQTAKGNDQSVDKRRNALGISLSVRGGSETLLRLRWDDQPAQNSLTRAIRAYLDRSLPSRVAYDLRALHEQTVFARSEPAGIGIRIQAAEVRRMFDKARTRDGGKIDVGHVDWLTERARTLEGLNQLADELIVARWLAARVQRDLGEIGERT